MRYRAVRTAVAQQRNGVNIAQWVFGVYSPRGAPLTEPLRWRDGDWRAVQRAFLGGTTCCFRKRSA